MIGIQTPGCVCHGLILQCFILLRPFLLFTIYHGYCLAAPTRFMSWWQRHLSHCLCHRYVASITQSTFEGNSAQSAGGAWFSTNVRLSAASTSFTNNTALTAGAGLTAGVRGFHGSALPEIFDLPIL